MKSNIQNQKYYYITYKKLAKKLGIPEKICNVRNELTFFGEHNRICIEVKVLE